MDEMTPIFRLIATSMVFFGTLQCVAMFYVLHRNKAISGDDVLFFFIHISLLFAGTISWIWQR